MLRFFKNDELLATIAMNSQRSYLFIFHIQNMRNLFSFKLDGPIRLIEPIKAPVHFKKQVPVSKVLDSQAGAHPYTFHKNADALHLFVKNSSDKKTVRSVVKFFNKDLVFVQPHRLVCLRSLKKKNKDFSFAKTELSLHKVKNLGEITCCIGQQGPPLRVKPPDLPREDRAETSANSKTGRAGSQSVHKSLASNEQERSIIRKLTLVNSFKKNALRKGLQKGKAKKAFDRQNQLEQPREGTRDFLSIITGHRDGYLILWKDMAFQEIVDKLESQVRKIYKFAWGFLVLEDRQLLHIFGKGFFHKAKTVDLNAKVNFQLPSRTFVNIFGTEKFLFLISKSLNVIKLSISPKSTGASTANPKSGLSGFALSARKVNFFFSVCGKKHFQQILELEKDTYCILQNHKSLDLVNLDKNDLKKKIIFPEPISSFDFLERHDLVILVGCANKLLLLKDFRLAKVHCFHNEVRLISMFPTMFPMTKDFLFFVSFHNGVVAKLKYCEKNGEITECGSLELYPSLKDDKFFSDLGWLTRNLLPEGKLLQLARKHRVDDQPGDILVINKNSFSRVEPLKKVLARNDPINLKNIETIFWHFPDTSDQHCSQVSFYGDYQNASTLHSKNDLFFVNLHNVSKNVLENNLVTLEVVFKEFQKNRELESHELFVDVENHDEWADQGFRGADGEPELQCQNQQNQRLDRLPAPEPPGVE